MITTPTTPSTTGEAAAPPELGLVKRWSFSKLMQFEKCPHSVYLSDVEKSERPPIDPNSPLERGNRVHKAAEDFIQGHEERIAHELRKVAPDLEAIKQMWNEGLVEIEQPWGIDLNWEPVDFFAPNVWGRAKLDVFIRHDENSATVIDWKTGKKMGNEVKHTQQGQTYMLWAFMREPDLQSIRTVFKYTDEGKELAKVYQRSDVPKYLQKFTNRALRMTTAKVFPPKPNKMNCMWCQWGTKPGVGTGACAFAVDP